MYTQWLKIFDQHDVKFIALDLRSDGDLVKFVRSQPEWVVDFENGESVLFARSAG